MNQLDKWNKELEKISLDHERKIDRKLFNFYREALIDIKKKVKIYIDEYETLSFSKKLEVERILKVANEIEKILDGTYSKVNKEIENYASNQAQGGYYGTWYALEGAENIQIDFPILNQRYIETIVNTPVNGKLFSQRLYDNTTFLAEVATLELQQGAINGDGYRKIAKRIEEQTEAAYKRALRIARTEGGRTQSTAKQRAYEEAKNKGVNIQKQWMSTLDKKTRHSHQKLDGQIVGVDEEFVSPNGNRAQGPRLFGVPREDINCRCTTVAVVNGISPELRKDNETKGIIKYKNYEEWKKDKIKDIGEKRWNIEEKKVKNKSSDSNQFERYKKILGKEVPKTLDDFQELKYNNSKEWQSIQDHYFVKSRLKDGRYGKVINPEKQAAHIESTRTEGKSYFYDNMDVQELFDKYAGTGTIERDSRGKRTNKETIITDNIIGYDQLNRMPVRGIKIHHSKKRTHIVPFKGRS
jgi:SPP1 gp7 family putative phage head morphogenesis protein|nr:MAG TPA: minor capsid protein [Caudoviricetes sp.]